MKTLYRRLIYKLKGVYRRLFDKPNIKVGDILDFQGRVATGYYFSWEYCTWFITTNSEFNVSWGLEKWYRDNMKKETSNGKETNGGRMVS